MSVFTYEEPELIIGLNRKIIFVNPYDCQIFKEIIIPEDLTPLIKIPAPPPEPEEPTEPTEKSDSDDEDRGGAGGGDGVAAVHDKPTTSQRPAKKIKLDENRIIEKLLYPQQYQHYLQQIQQHQPKQKQIPAVQHCIYSPCHKYIAITTTGHKALLIYRVREESATLLSVRELVRAASALVYAPDSSSVLVSDKAGDCYKFDCANDEGLHERPQLLFGQLSIVYDIVWTQGFEYIITCDRDDKIRVTNYPDTHIIHTYCLGHKEFVCGLAVLDYDQHELLSLSGDGTLRVWNYSTGEELFQHQLPEPGLRMRVYPCGPQRYEVAMLLNNRVVPVGKYMLVKTLNGQWVCQMQQLLSVGYANVANFCLKGNHIYTANVERNRLAVHIYDQKSDSFTPPDNWFDMVNGEFADDVFCGENYADWFKKRYDNVKEYMERKQKRIEEQKKRKETMSSR